MADWSLDSRGNATAVPAVDLDSIVRSILFLATFLLVWVSLHPFHDLSVPPQQLTEGGDRANQIGFSLMFMTLAAWVAFNRASRLKLLLQPVLIVMLVWFVLSVVASWEPALSARRLAFTFIVMAMAAIVLLLPKNIRHFAGLIAAATLIILALSYLGVVLAPARAIHQASDSLEPEHAGSWRGVFPHKNQAGAAMVMIAFIGLFVARVRSAAVGIVTVALALVFLVCSYSKTAIALLPAVMLVSFLIAKARRRWIALVIALAPLVALNLLPVGSIYFEQVREVLGLVMRDTSFTGRTDIWQFAMDALAQRPITGYGFGAFWGTEHVVYGLSQSATWATAASDAHNAYLNLALTTGIPGLVLVIVWIAVLPVVDFQRRTGNEQTEFLSLLFLRIWLFGIYSSSFESTLFQQVGEVWFIMLVALFGLRLQSESHVTT